MKRKKFIKKVGKPVFMRITFICDETGQILGHEIILRNDVQYLKLAAAASGFGRLETKNDYKAYVSVLFDKYVQYLEEKIKDEQLQEDRE